MKIEAWSVSWWRGSAAKVILYLFLCSSSMNSFIVLVTIFIIISSVMTATPLLLCCSGTFMRFMFVWLGWDSSLLWRLLICHSQNIVPNE